MQVLSNGIAVLPHDTHLSKWVQEHGRLDFDQNVLPFVLPYIKSGAVIIDVGANIGCYAYAFIKKAGVTGRIFCFEPSEESYECLEHNMRGFKNCHLYNKALSYKEGYCVVVRENDNVGMNFCEEVQTGIIKTVTIDDMDLPRVNFIKLDCEGDELNVLIGGQRTIRENKPVMFIEINTHTLKRKKLTPEDIFRWLDNNGYKYSNVYPDQEMVGDQYDIIAVSK